MPLRPSPARNSDALRGMYLCVVFSCFVFGTYAYNHYKPYTFALYDSGWHVHQVVSLLSDGDIDLRNQLGNDPRRASDLIALGARGEWFPMHEPLLAILAIPFYAIAGVNGCLVLNIILCTLLVACLYAIALEAFRPVVALCATSLASYCSVLLPYSYDFSIDVLGAVLLMFSFLAALRERPLVSGLLWGAAIFGRGLAVVTLPAFLVLIVLARRKVVDTYPRSIRETVLAFLFGVAPGMLAILLMNGLMFGDFFTFRYSRWAEISGGALALRSQWAEYGSPFFKGLQELLLHRQKGVLVSQPLLIPALMGVPLLWQRARAHAAGFMLTMLVMLVFFAQYKGALNTTDGNRYFIFALLLCALPLAELLERLGAVSKLVQGGRERI